MVGKMYVFLNESPKEAISSEVSPPVSITSSDNNAIAEDIFQVPIFLLVYQRN